MTKIFIHLFFLILCSNAYSQTKTPYQKKYDQIMIEMCEAIGVENSLIQLAIKSDDWDLVRSSQDFAFKSKMLEKEDLIALIFITDQKLKDAENLKTEIDFTREKEIKEKEETEREKKEYEENYQYSDYNKLTTKIQTEFRLWAAKGEFEKSEEYKSRMMTMKQEFDKICITAFSEYNDDKFRNRAFYYFVNLDKYNADAEFFSVGISSNFKNYDTIPDTLIVNMTLAKQLKESVVEFRNNLEIEPENIKNWVFYKNELYPKFFIIQGRKHTINFFKNYSLKIETNSIGLNDFFSENHVFDFEKYFNEKEIEDKNTRDTEIITKENEERLRQFEYSDLGKIQKETKSQFTDWLKKGEFESSKDYQARIQKSSEVKFIQIREEVIKNKMNGGSLQILDYNADLEILEVENWTQKFNVKVSSEIAIILKKCKKAYYYPINIGLNSELQIVPDKIYILFDMACSQECVKNGLGGTYGLTNIYTQDGKVYGKCNEGSNPTYREQIFKEFEIIEVNNMDVTKVYNKLYYSQITNSIVGNNSKLLKFTIADLKIELPSFE